MRASGGGDPMLRCRRPDGDRRWLRSWDHDVVMRASRILHTLSTPSAHNATFNLPQTAKARD